MSLDHTHLLLPLLTLPRSPSPSPPPIHVLILLLLIALITALIHGPYAHEYEGHPLTCS